MPGQGSYFDSGPPMPAQGKHLIPALQCLHKANKMPAQGKHSDKALQCLHKANMGKGCLNKALMLTRFILRASAAHFEHSSLACAPDVHTVRPLHHGTWPNGLRFRA